jgi:HEPN domain-containing protein
MVSSIVDYSKWILKAESDFKIIEKDIVSNFPVTNVICFHCQQAAEKYLKAYLVSRNVIPERTHLIERLIFLCMKFDIEFSELSEAARLTEYAVELRYPDDFYIPDLEETKKAYEIALKVKEFVLKKLNLLK